MFQKAQLAHLRQRKEVLVLQCDTRRLLLAVEWQKLRSPAAWWSAAGSTALQHPMLTATLGVGAGVIAMQALRRPGAVLGALSRLAGVGSSAWSAWKMFRGGGRQP